MSLNNVDIVIVGAGPTGLALASDLCRRGISPLVLDRLEAGANTSRAAVVHARTLEVLEPLGVTGELLQNGVIVPIFRVRDRSRILTSISFGDLQTHFPFTLMCPQNRTEAILLSRLESLGGSVRRPCEVASIGVSEAGVEAQYESEGAMETVHAKWLVGCDGGHSVVRKQASIPFEGSTYEESFILADVEMDWPLDREEVSLFFSEQGLVVVAPLPDNRFRIVATARQAEETPSLSDLQTVLEERGPDGAKVLIRRLVWASRFRVSHRVAREFRKGNILLAGDAAHVHSPAGGQGMNTGIQDAVSLADALAAVLHGESAALLDQWAESRRKIARSIVQMTDRMTRMATASSPVLRLFRNAVIEMVGHLPMAQHALAVKLAELDNR